VLWRSTVLGCYPALAVFIAFAYGGGALGVLLFYYVIVAAWFAFVLALGSLARSAGRWNYERVRRTGRWTFGRVDGAG